MRKINLSDITIRESSLSKDVTLSFKEKIEMAKIMDKLNYSVIELPEITDPQTDSLLIKTMATGINDNKIACPVGYRVEDVKTVWNCVKNAKRPVLTVSVPVSSVQMEYLCHMKPKVIAELIPALVSECKKYCDEVEFSAGDSTRAESEFLVSCIDSAITAGASKITLCDTAGTMMPDEFGSFVTEIKKSVPALSRVTLAVEVKNEIDMATACVFAAVAAGADEIKTTVKGFGYPEIENVVSVIEKRGNDMGVKSTIRATELRRGVSQMVWITSSKKTGVNEATTVVAGDSPDVVLTADDDINTVATASEAIGYDLSAEDKKNVYDAFLRVARKKKKVGRRELEAIIASSALSVPATYKIESYVINSGNVITATANILLSKNGEKLSGVCVGDGPIDASFLAIEQILGHHYELDDFQIQAVTEGREAMGSALVKLRADNGKLYSGNGISTDIIGASIRAYVSAINKIVYEEA